MSMENNAASVAVDAFAAYSNYLYVFCMFLHINGKYFLNFLPTTGILYSVMRRMSASLFYSRIVDLFVEVREREWECVSRCFYSVYTSRHTHYTYTYYKTLCIAWEIDLYDGETVSVRSTTRMMRRNFSILNIICIIEFRKNTNGQKAR